MTLDRMAPAIEHEDNVEFTLSHEDMESVATLFAAIKSLRTPRKAELEALNAAFESHMGLVTKRLDERLADMPEDVFRRKAEVLMAKHGLFDIVFSEAINFCVTLSPQLAAVLRKLRMVHTSLFQQYPSVLSGLQGAAAQEMVGASHRAEEAEHEATQLLEAAELLEKEMHEQKAELARLRQALDQAVRDNNALQTMRYRRRVEPDEDGTVVTRRSTLASTVRSNSRVTTSSSRPTPPPKKPAGPVLASVQGSRNSQCTSSTSSTRSNSKKGAGAGPASPTASATTTTAGPAPSEDESRSSIRSLSLKQLKEMIESIYVSKDKHDRKCMDARLPRETLEQHAYTWVNHRYGLKRIILVNAASLHQAVQRYCNQDADVAVFSKTLQHQVDEDYPVVHRRLKEAVFELLRIHVRNQNPMKSDDTIQTLMTEKMKGVLQEKEWMSIVQYMYNHEDGLTLCLLVKERARQSRPDGHKRPPEPVRGRPRAAWCGDGPADQSAVISFTDFLHVLLSFQLHAHERFLSRFRHLFAALDTDNDGVLTEQQFVDLVRKVGPGKAEKEVQDILCAVDPYTTQKVTFSQAVAVLSDQLVQDHAGAV